MSWPALSARSKNWGTEILTDSDLESELDLLHDYVNDALNSSTGHKHDGTTAEGPKILTANIDDAAGTAGDIYTNTSGTTVGRVAIGTANQVLAVNSGATAPEWVTSVNFAALPDGAVLQVVNSETQTAGSDANANVAYTTDAFLITEGTQVLSLAVTPKATTHKILVRVVVNGTHSDSAATMAIGLFNTDVHATNADAVSSYGSSGNNDTQGVLVIEKWYTASDLNGTSATTFTVRYGADAGTAYVNQDNGGVAVYGGKLISSITITEIKAA